MRRLVLIVIYRMLSMLLLFLPWIFADIKNIWLPLISCPMMHQESIQPYFIFNQRQTIISKYLRLIAMWAANDWRRETVVCNMQKQWWHRDLTWQQQEHVIRLSTTPSPRPCMITADLWKDGNAHKYFIVTDFIDNQRIWRRHYNAPSFIARKNNREEAQ